jgi:hypothetical protein
MEAILICLGIWLAISLVDKALAVKSEAIRREIEWRLAHPEEAEARAEERARAEIAGLVECGLSEEEAVEFWWRMKLDELREFVGEPC